MSAQVTDQPVLELFEEAPLKVLPTCGVCGAVGSEIVVGEEGVRDLHAASLWAVVEISRHEREMHGARR